MRKRACIVKRGRTWAVKQPLPDGHYKWTTTGPRKRDAEALRDDLNRRTLLGGAYVEPPRTWKAVRDEWVAAYALRSRPASVAIVKTSLRHLDGFEQRPVETLRAGELEAFIVALARRSPRMSPTDFVSREDGAAHRPRARPGRSTRPSSRSRPPDRRRARACFSCSPGNRSKTLGSWMPRRPRPHRPLRRSEPDCAKANAYGFATAISTSPPAPVRVRQLQTRAGVRLVDLPPTALGLLREQLLAPARPGTELLFSSPTGRPLDRHRFMARDFRPAAVRAGLGHPRRRPPLHRPDVPRAQGTPSFRSMASAGVHVSVIASMVGHSDGGALAAAPLPAPVPARAASRGGRIPAARLPRQRPRDRACKPPSGAQFGRIRRAWCCSPLAASDSRIALISGVAAVLGALVGGAVTGFVALRAKDKRQTFSRELEQQRRADDQDKERAAVRAASRVMRTLSVERADIGCSDDRAARVVAGRVRGFRATTRSGGGAVGRFAYVAERLGTCIGCVLVNCESQRSGGGGHRREIRCPTTRCSVRFGMASRTDSWR